MTNHSVKDFLVEIGAEEIPAGYIVPALEAFRDNLLKSMDKFRIEHGDAQILGTPRRLAVIVKDVADMQKARTSTLTGPPANAGFDKDGKPTIAAHKFAEKAGVSIEEIKIVETEKGNYLSALKQEKCESTATILEAALPELILSIPFPKSMRWGDLAISFARPIISLLALMGETVLNFEIGTATPLSQNIRSSDFVFGHQFMNPGKFKVSSASEYKKVLKDAGVIVDIEERKALLQERIEAVAKENKSIILKDEELVDIVTNLVEYPWPVIGRFDEKFLEVPDEALITAMREHQKYFSLADSDGKLKPCFIAVNNTCTKDMGVVANGHERVLRARLSDAQFFYKVDLESTMDQFAEKLKKVTFQAQLGSMFEKRERLAALGSYMVDLLAPTLDKTDGENKVMKENVIRAARICKADLVSQMVIEFTKLQGVIGRVYAQKGGENNDVATAIEQHYRPVHSGGALPDTLTGKILAIADKIDTICGCFSIDLVPTGASDPYALRRQSIGILQIMMASGFTFSIKNLVEKSISLYLTKSQIKTDHYKQNSPEKQPFSEKQTAIEREEVIAENVMGFIKTRMTNMLVDQGYSKEAVASALAVGFENVPDAVLRIKALDLLRQAPDFEPLSAAFKRVVNILKKSEPTEKSEPAEGSGSYKKVEVDESLFFSDSEKSLYVAAKALSSRVDGFISRGDYNLALKEIASIRPEVDSFFDDVMVMVDDEAVKNNRIALLSTVASIFEHIADFSQI
ncbi:MAG: glycine--tRNA ligase subunit beta [Desulfamplus sp.]|nr:glycine--tRNA ligase subunit beta [Desulfamplus sp.]